MSEEAKRTKYPVLSPVLMGGRLYAIGEDIPLSAELFEQLKATGAIGLEPTGGPAAADSGAPPGAEQRAAAIRAAVAALPDSGFAKGGKPKVGAVEKIVGFETTVAEIEAAIATA